MVQPSKRAPAYHGQESGFPFLAQISNTKEFYYLYTLVYEACGQHGSKSLFLFLVPVSAYFTLMVSFLPETYLPPFRIPFTFCSWTYYLSSLLGGLDGYVRAMSVRHSSYPIVADSRAALCIQVLDRRQRSVPQMVNGR